MLSEAKFKWMHLSENDVFYRVNVIDSLLVSPVERSYLNTGRVVVRLSVEINRSRFKASFLKSPCVDTYEWEKIFEFKKSS